MRIFNHYHYAISLEIECFHALLKCQCNEIFDPFFIWLIYFKEVFLKFTFLQLELKLAY